MSLDSFMLVIGFVIFGHFLTSINKSTPSNHIMRKITFWFLYVIIECVMIILLLGFSQKLQGL